MLLENTGWRDVGILRPRRLVDDAVNAGPHCLLLIQAMVLQGFDPAECARLWMPHPRSTPTTTVVSMTIIFRSATQDRLCQLLELTGAG